MLSDTVGFISDLPTQLVAAFRATLEEVLEADVIVHVRDIAHPETEAQRADVLDVLEDLGVAEDRLAAMVEARNKIDLLDAPAREDALGEAARASGAFAVSALTGDGLDALLRAVDAAMRERRIAAEVSVPLAEGRAQAWLHGRGVVTATVEDADADRTVLSLSITERELNQFAKQFPDAAIRRDDPAITP
jgi:GTP-binding protein HflX